VEFTDLTEKTFVMVGEHLDLPAQQLFIFDNLAEHSGNTKRYDEVDTETYASRKSEGADASKARAGVAYNITMTAKRIAREIDITFEMRRYNKAPQVVAAMLNLASFCPERVDLDLTHRLTFATSTSYTDQDGDSVTISVGDGLALVSTVHTLDFSASTYSNQVAGNPVFSQTGLEAAELLAVTNILSNYGEKRKMNFNTIVSGDDPNTVNAIKQVLNSTADVDAAHAGVMNTYSGKYRHVVLPNLATDANGAYNSAKRQWWGLIAVNGTAMNSWQAYYGVFEPNNLKTPSAGNNGEDIHNDNWTYGTRMSYGDAILSGRGFIMANPVS